MSARDEGSPASTPITAGALYFALVFAAGFALGTLRVVVLAPRVGALGAVAVELPIILALSWFACGFIVARLRVPPRFDARVEMGGVALALLLFTEFALAAAFGDGSLSFAQSWLTAEGALGLAGQILFAAFPVLRLPR
jgi:hypothetical protein